MFVPDSTRFRRKIYLSINVHSHSVAVGRRAIWAVAIAFVVVVGAFGIYLARSTSTSLGSVSIMVKDLPDDWTHINVTFSQASIHQASDENNSSWHNLTLTRQTIDLASLVNISELLASGDVGPGKYTQIRIVVEAVVGTMNDGSTVNFTVPSGVLKTNHPFNVTAGKTTTLTLDIDLSRSIVHNSSGWIFKPVLGSVTNG
jgi:hypothetical protein